jgi:succinoglycan biosynthesis protein ExoM
MNFEQMPVTVSICLATYRRNEQLALLLADLAAQTRRPDEVIVVDNDAAGGARALVESLSMPFQVRYDVQPVKNISITRNKTVELASGDWLAFIDDDERAPPEWLELMLQTVTDANADGVLGHVRCIVPADAPEWVARGDFYGSPKNPHGQIFPLNRISKGNALLRGARVRALEGPFDPALGLTGGEDADLFTRFNRGGGRIVWCGTVELSEPVEHSRMNARWLMLRALRGGQDFARHLRRGDFRPVRPLESILFFFEFLAKVLIGAVLGTVLRPLGRHHAVKWWVVAAANLGKLSSYFGLHYREYSVKPQSGTA